MPLKSHLAAVMSADETDGLVQNIPVMPLRRYHFRLLIFLHKSWDDITKLGWMSLQGLFINETTMQL